MQNQSDASTAIDKARARAIAAEARIKDLEEKLKDADVTQPRSWLTKSQICKQAADTAMVIMREAAEEAQKASAAEAKILDLEKALAEAVGEAAVVPSPSKPSPTIQKPAPKGAHGEVAVEPQDEELQVELVLLEEARANQTDHQVDSREDQWTRIRLQQEASAQVKPSSRKPNLPEPIRGDGVSQETRKLFSDAAANITADKWKDSILKQFAQMEDKIRLLQDAKLDLDIRQTNVMSQDAAQIELYRRIDAVVTIVAELHMKSTQRLKRCIHSNCSLPQQLGAQ